MERPHKPGWLERMAFHRPELRAWALYDLANSAMITTVVTAVYPIYFTNVAAAGLDPDVAAERHGWATTIALALVALLSPVLGALADQRAVKKKLLATFAGVGIAATACLFLVQQGDWLLGMVLFGLANLGASASFVFYDALLPHVAREDEVDRVSTMAYALGYVGGGLMLALNLAWIQKPEWFGLPSGEGLSPSEATLPTRLAFLSVAVWWALFTIPLLRHVSEPPASRPAGEAVARTRVVRDAVAQLIATLRELRSYRHAALLLVAFLIYNDGIQTIYRMATLIGDAKGFSQGAMITAIILVQFVGIPFAILFGQLATRFGAKRMVLVGVAFYGVITFFGYSMETERQFFVLAIMVGAVQGGCQALSRSLFASMIPATKSGEFFALFAVGEKFAGIFGPALFALSIRVTGSTETAILSVLVFFAVGGFLLSRVDVEAGRAQVRDAMARPPAQST